MKTAIQQAIEACDELAAKSEHASLCVKIMKEFLIKERISIERAYGSGFNQGLISVFRQTDYKNTSDYYEKTFEQ